MKKENLKWLPLIGIVFGVNWFYEQSQDNTILWEHYQYTCIFILLAIIL